MSRSSRAGPGSFTYSSLSAVSSTSQVTLGIQYSLTSRLSFRHRLTLSLPHWLHLFSLMTSDAAVEFDVSSAVSMGRGLLAAEVRDLRFCSLLLRPPAEVFFFSTFFMLSLCLRYFCRSNLINSFCTLIYNRYNYTWHEKCAVCLNHKRWTIRYEFSLRILKKLKMGNFNSSKVWEVYNTQYTYRVASIFSFISLRQGFPQSLLGSEYLTLLTQIFWDQKLPHE